MCWFKVKRVNTVNCVNAVSVNFISSVNIVNTVIVLHIVTLVTIVCVCTEHRDKLHHTVTTFHEVDERIKGLCACVRSQL